MFELHSQLAKDTIHVGAMPLCDVLLMNDKQYPWLILVPRRKDVREIYELSAEDQKQLIKESSLLSIKMQIHFQAEKMNVAALGNMVPQLHVHHIARYATDAAWPKPVWGVQASVAYPEDELDALLTGLRALLAEVLQ